jgi:hypothetical protein
MAAGAAEGGYVDADELLRRNTQNLMAAVSSLPELQEQKKVNSMTAVGRLCFCGATCRDAHWAHSMGVLV